MSRAETTLQGGRHWRGGPDPVPTGWVTVGAAGAPDYEGTWTGTVRYARDAAGDTELDGAATGGDYGDVIFYLPSSYWPIADTVRVGWLSSAGTPVMVTVAAADGAVTIAEITAAGGGPPTGAAGGVLSGSYPNPGFAADMATQAELDAHTADTTAAHAASAISYAGASGLSATEVEAALDELDSEKQPLDSDLTAIAALTTASYGRSLLEAAAQTGLPFTFASHTPALTGSVSNPTIGNGTTIGWYAELGDFVFYYFRVVFGSTSTFGSGNWSLSLPVNHAARDTQMCFGLTFMQDVTGSGGIATPTVRLDSGSPGTLTFRYPAAWPNGASQPVTPTAPWTWGTGHNFSGFAVYEKA